MGEARPPTQSGQDQCFPSALRHECSAEASMEQGGRRSCAHGLRVIVPWWRSSSCRSGLQWAATFGMAQRWWRWHSSRVASFGSSPRLWRCSILLCALFACVVCVVVVFASARYVRILLLLIWCGSAPAFYFKKKWGFFFVLYFFSSWLIGFLHIDRPTSSTLLANARRADLIPYWGLFNKR